MKFIKNFMAVPVMLMLILASCSKDEQMDTSGEISKDVAVLYLGPVLDELNNQNKQQDQNIPACSEDEPAYAQIGLTFGPGNTPLSVTVEILKDNDGYFTAYDDELEIPVVNGNTVDITLTDFIVRKDSPQGDVIWVSPKKNSEYAKYVSNPLSREFTLRAGSKNYVDVEVICYDDRDVNLYGYQFFDITPIELTKFCVFANLCKTPNGRDYVANYTFDLYSYSGDEVEANPMTNMSLYDEIVSGESPNTGKDGDTYYADPLCIAIPVGDSQNPDKPYLYYTITAQNWPGYYGGAPNISQSGYLTWSQVKALLDKDGDDTTVDYMHFFLNCPGGGDPTCLLDTDGDGVNDCDDECPGYDDNADQDGDNIADGCDNCPENANRNQADSDGDGYGDVCDYCPELKTSTNVDTDGDGVGDDCDKCTDVEGSPDNFGCPDDPCIDGADPDNDGVKGNCDNCPNKANPLQTDTDNDGVGDACDNCPADANEDQADKDGDLVGDTCDNCPDDANRDQANSDGDSYGDVCDNCPTKTNEDQADGDGDGIGDVCDKCPTRSGVPNNDPRLNGCPIDEQCPGLDLDNDGWFGDCDCDGNTKYNTSNICDEEPGQGECGQTAYMQGNVRFDQIAGVNSNRWGWVHDFTITGNITTEVRKIYAGASTNYNLNDETNIGTVTVTFNNLTNELTLKFDFDQSAQELDIVHVNISEQNPDKFSPGQYNQPQKTDVGDGDILTYTYNNVDSSFKIIVHGEGACKDATSKD